MILKTTIVSLSKETIKVYKEPEVVLLRNRVKEYTIRIKMGLVNQTKLITAVSELARNMLRYAGGGEVVVEVVTRGRENGVRLLFIDKGPGIADIQLAMKDGFSTAKSMGLGLPGTKRLVSEFDLSSEINKGTTVTIIKWVNG